MDRPITRLPIAADDDSLDRALFEVQAAIAMVVAGVAVTVIGPRLATVGAETKAEIGS